MFDQQEASREVHTSESPCTEATATQPDPLSRLTERLLDNGFTHFLLSLREQFPEAHLKDLVAQELDAGRRIRIGRHTVINFGSDSFLGLDQDPRVQEAIAQGVRKWGTHNGSSRAFCSIEANVEAEARLASWLAVEDTLIFPSVTLANMSLLPALAGARDLLVVDRQAHNSIQEGAKIAGANGARIAVLAPCTPERLESLLAREKYKGCVVALDGVYSMTGASPPLAELDRVARAHGGVLYIDDAHGTGIFGPRGRGMAARALGRLDQVLMVGSLSKAFSCLGAFVSCSSDLKLVLKMKSSSYIFGGPVPPPYLEAIRVVCDILCSSEFDTLMGKLRRLIQRLVAGARSLDLPVLGGDSPIVAILIQDEAKTLRAGKWLFDRGFYVQSVIFPAVPLGGGVLRIQVNANHSREAVDGLLSALADLKKEMCLSLVHAQRPPP
ncbi:MAG TPA: pyridoxal phosphate-dependent aminotransferase family protein [Gemmataceae bacterium]|nr:pyridoxal phosphate-dependent aminotransferase family protein [Gemmataceae bacterium]